MSGLVKPLTGPWFPDQGVFARLPCWTAPVSGPLGTASCSRFSSGRAVCRWRSDERYRRFVADRAV